MRQVDRDEQTNAERYGQRREWELHKDDSFGAAVLHAKVTLRTARTKLQMYESSYKSFGFDVARTNWQLNVYASGVARARLWIMRMK